MTATEYVGSDLALGGSDSVSGGSNSTPDNSDSLPGGSDLTLSNLNSGSGSPESLPGSSEYVILVDEQDHALGIAEKLEAHQKNLLHRAFSVFIFRCKPEARKEISFKIGSEISSELSPKTSLEINSEITSEINSEISTETSSEISSKISPEINSTKKPALSRRPVEILLQQRALHKYHTPGLWTNTCCSHPRPQETVIEAAQRRLEEEMGLAVGNLKDVGWFTYNAHFANGLSEHELDHVLIGELPPEAEVKINRDEVHDYRWVSIEDLKQEMHCQPERFTPWLEQALGMAVRGHSGEEPTLPELHD